MTANRIRNSICLPAVCLAALAVVTFAPEAQAQSPSGQAAPPATPILNNDSYLRAYFVHRTPVLITPDGQTRPLTDPTARQPGPLPDFQSPPPPQDWTNPDFDDATWDRTRSPVEPDQPDGYTYGSRVAWHAAAACSRICLRSRFVVDDPLNATGLRLSLEYVGGVVAYVNGREVARGHLPAGELDPDAAAERYPDDLYCEPGGLFLQDIKKNPDGFARRYRRLTDVAVPAAILRKGVNVLAIEIRRAPVNEAAAKAKRQAVGGMSVVPGLWSYAELRSLDLSAAPGSTVRPNVARPAGLQVWTCAPYDTVTAFDYGQPGQPLPVVLSAAPNGVFNVHTHNFNAHVWGGIAARLSGVKVIEHVHDYRYEEPLYLEKRGVRPDQFRLAKYFAKLSDSIVVLTKNNKNLLLRNRIASDRKIKMLLNGINPKFNQSVDGYELRKKHCIPADRRIIFAAARISQEKNIGAVIDIAEISVQRCDKVIFVIAGDGPLKNELEENVKKRNLDNIVRFIGFCPNVKEFLKISNIFIQPTLLELHSITMIEAMSMGVPVLVSQGVGCNDYFITHGENGFLLDPYKPEVWAQTINLLLDNQSLSNTIGNAGSKLIENECDIKKTVKNIENLYYDLVSTM